MGTFLAVTYNTLILATKTSLPPSLLTPTPFSTRPQGDQRLRAILFGEGFPILKRETSQRYCTIGVLKKKINDLPGANTSRVLVVAFALLSFKMS